MGGIAEDKTLLAEEVRWKSAKKVSAPSSSSTIFNINTF